MMRLNFNETYIVNSLLTKPNKRAFIEKLKSLLEDESLDKELRTDMEKLKTKFESLSENQVRIIYEDKVNGKVTTLPQYEIK